MGTNLDVKRVKYQYKQTSPGGAADEYSKLSLEQEEHKGKEIAGIRGSGAAAPSTSPF